MVVFHVLQVALLTDEQVQVLLPLRVHGLHVCLPEERPVTAAQVPGRPGEALRGKHVRRAEKGRHLLYEGNTHLNGVPPWMLSCQQLVAFSVEFVNSFFFGLQVPVDEILSGSRWGQHLASCPCVLLWTCTRPCTHLVLAPAAGVVQVTVTPVILHTALGLLV